MPCESRGGGGGVGWGGGGNRHGPAFSWVRVLMGKFYVGSKRRSIFARCCAGSLLEMLDIVSPFIKEDVLLISAKKTIANLVWSGFEVTVVIVDREEPWQLVHQLWQLVHHVYSTTAAHTSSIAIDRCSFDLFPSPLPFSLFSFFFHPFPLVKYMLRTSGKISMIFFSCFLEIL